VLLFVLVCALDARGQQKRPELVDEGVAWIKQFVKTVYPDLDERLSMTISGQEPVRGGWTPGGPFMVQVGNANWETSLHPQGPAAFMSLKVGVRMDKWGRVHEAWGGLTDFAKSRERFSKQVEQHGEWTDAQAVQALASEGAQFGPDARERLLTRLPLKQLEPFIGACTIHDLTFELREDNGGSPGLPKYRAALHWRLTLRDCARPGEQSLTYILLFEPFGGTLHQMMTVGWRPGPSNPLP
jgi:hypothetical protein